MIVLTPKADDEALNPAMIAGLMSQTIPVEWVVVSRPRDLQNRRWSIEESRNVLTRFAPSDGYCFMVDSDVVLDQPDVLERLLDAAKEHHADAMMIHTKGPGGTGPHRRIALVCIEGAVLKRFGFGGPPCDCRQLGAQCEVMVLDAPGSCHEEANTKIERT